VSASTPIPIISSGMSACAEEGWKQNPKVNAIHKNTIHNEKFLILLMIPLLFLLMFTHFP
jgi:hypothetical protein